MVPSATKSLLLLASLLAVTAGDGDAYRRAMNMRNAKTDKRRAPGSSVPDLFTPASGSTGNVDVCKGAAVISCTRVTVNRIAFLRSKELRIHGVVFTNRGMEGHTKMYVSDDRTVSTGFVRVWPSARRQIMTGSFEMEDGHYRLQPCGNKCHVLMKINMTLNRQAYPSNLLNRGAEPEQLRQLTDEQQALDDQGTDDQITQAEMSISFYHTPELQKAATDFLDSSMEQVVASVLEISNIILRNNGVPLKIVAHCILGTNIREPASPVLKTDDAMAAMKSLRGSVRSLLNSADAAALLTLGRTEIVGQQICGYTNGSEHFRNHGIDPILIASYFDVQCFDDFTFLHELSALIGARHERLADSHQSNAHAYIFESGQEVLGTLMASRHFIDKRVPYYSRPTSALDFCPGSVDIGNEANNNKNIMITNRFLAAGFGEEDETWVCGTAGPTTTTTTTVPPPPPCNDNVVFPCISWMCWWNGETRNNCPRTCGAC